MIRVPVPPMQQKYAPLQFCGHISKVAYTDWGDADNPDVLVCAHGALRHSRDFDVLAAGLADRVRVIAVDLPGRGQSEWLADPSLYTPALYRAVFQSLVAELRLGPVDWIGSSMGGGLGLALAATQTIPIRRLILNDSGTVRGPNVPVGGAPEDPIFHDLEEAEAFLRKRLAPYGIQDAQVWCAFARHSTRPIADGRLRLHHDPALGGAGPAASNSWDLWDKLRIPVLILRGAESLSLARETADEMVRRHPRAELIEFAGCGHFPSLTEPRQVAVVREWLTRAPCP